MDRFKRFETYAKTKGINGGEITFNCLKQLWNQYKGSRWDLIIEHFKLKGQMMFIKEYENMVEKPFYDKYEGKKNI